MNNEQTSGNTFTYEKNFVCKMEDWVDICKKQDCI